MSQDTGKSRTNIRDQFYTKESVAIHCIGLILENIESPQLYAWLEPSAGSGSFFNNIPHGLNKVGIDIDPKSADIVQADFLEWTPNFQTKVIVVGNPPFGKQSSLAKKFIRRSCEFADVVAFILPRSFTKPSMFSAFDTKFHCIVTEELGTNSFIVNDEEYDVPCVFQIWKRFDIDRVDSEKVEPIGFSYVKDTDSYDIAVRRVGVYAGRCYRASQESYSKQSHYFIKLPRKAKIDKIVEAMNKHEFPSNTVGPRSLSKHEINSVLNSIVS
jgi:hypothetical protein